MMIAYCAPRRIISGPLGGPKNRKEQPHEPSPITSNMLEKLGTDRESTAKAIDSADRPPYRETINVVDLHLWSGSGQTARYQHSEVATVLPVRSTILKTCRCTHYLSGLITALLGLNLGAGGRLIWRALVDNSASRAGDDLDAFLREEAARVVIGHKG